MNLKKISLPLAVTIIIILTTLLVTTFLNPKKECVCDECVCPEENSTKDPLESWKEDFFEPVEVDYSQYPDFYRGAWAPRIDIARKYLFQASDLRQAGIDTIILGIDIVMDPETSEAKSLGDNTFKFYIQAFQKQGFRVFIVPDPAHPSFDLGKGFDWGEEDSDNSTYHAGKELLDKFTPVVLDWASTAEQMNVYGFLPLLEPHVFAGEIEVASNWLEEILPQIRERFNGKVGVIDIMHNTGVGREVIPYPYDYSGYDFALGGPPAGRKPEILNEWTEDVEGYITKGIEYVQTYDLDGFALYEWGPYVGGVWYEDVQMCQYDQCLNEDEAQLVVQAGIDLQEDKEGIIGSFPIIGTGWIDFGTKGFEEIAHWYNRCEHFSVQPLEEQEWDYETILWYERVLAGDDYNNICTLDEWSICAE